MSFRLMGLSSARRSRRQRVDRPNPPALVGSAQSTSAPGGARARFSPSRRSRRRIGFIRVGVDSQLGQPANVLAPLGGGDHREHVIRELVEPRGNGAIRIEQFQIEDHDGKRSPLEPGLLEAEERLRGASNGAGLRPPTRPGSRGG